MNNQNITITEAQKLVDEWIKAIGVRYFSELTNMAILTEEVGELAKIIAREYGEQSFKKTDKKFDLADEMADVLWVLICLANQTGVDLNEALIKNMEKKTNRDKERHQNNPKIWSDVEVNSWFEKKGWLNGWDVIPDDSLNRRNLAIQYFKNPERWDKLFQFLASSDLKKLPKGKQELEGKNLYVIVDEYTTRNKSETLYESHKKYIDIQYMIEGEELMGLTTLDKVKVTEPYNPEKDVEFYSYEGEDYLKATPKNFFVFFPEDVHRPTLKVNDNIPVKKIVIKIMID